MAYTCCGDPLAAHAVVCVHGLTRQGRDFDVLAQALCALLPEGAAREAQVGALGRLDGLMRLEGGDTPSARAARIVLEMAR